MVKEKYQNREEYLNELREKAMKETDIIAQKLEIKKKFIF